MLNEDNKPFAPGKTENEGLPQKNPAVHVFREEDLKAYKDCLYSAFWKAGLPFAVVCQYLSSKFSKKVPGEAPPKVFSVGRGFMFFGNFLFGTFLYLPTCSYRLQALILEREKREKEMGISGSSTTDPLPQEIQPALQTDEFSFPSEMTTSLDASDFSSFQSTIDEEKLKLTRAMTYDDLRAQHRNRYAAKDTPPSLPSSGSGSIPTPPPVEKEEPKEVPASRRVRKNKYGDEIE